MKKSLTALAVMAAVAAPFAAQAGDMEAKIYGKFHMSIDYVDNGEGSLSGKEAINVTSNSSRFGIKGSADLGGGMKGIWQVENNVKPGEGTGDIGGRNTYLGLDTKGGKILMGRHDTPVKTISRKLDMFGDQMGDSRNVINTAGTDARPDEVVMYSSPSMGGAKLNVMANLGTGTDKQSLGLISASGVYKMGKDLYAAAGVQTMSADMTGGERENVIRAGAKYNMGAISVAALFQYSMNEKGVKDDSRIGYGVGAAYKMGKMKLKAQVYGTTAPDSDSDSTGNVIALGADQKLGDNTTAYVAIGYGMNGDSGTFGIAGGGHDSGKDIGSPAAGEAAMGGSLGIVHKF
jgi:predicted porin